MLICRDLRSSTGCGAQNPDDATTCAQCGRSLRYALALRNAGDKVGRYRLVRLIGHGGFGAVFEVEVISHPSVRVTLKETFDAESVRAFRKEFEVLRELRHDNMPRYFEVFENAGSGYLVMELVPGQSLEDVLRKQSGPVLEKLVLHYADQLCDVLSYLHSQNPPIIHRDIKPANVRLTPEGLIKLVDFGLLKQGTQTTHTERHRAGTLAYAPLEQWIGGTDQRSDIYSLGAMLYHLLTGRIPMAAGVRSSTSADPLTPPRELNPRLSTILDAAILKAMALDRDQRFPDIMSFHHELMRSAQLTRGTTPLGTPLHHPPAPPAPGPALSSAHMAVRVPTFTLLHSWSAHYDIINALAWSPGGELLASGSDDGRVRLWSVSDERQPEPAQAILGGVGRVFCVGWRPDGKVLASSGKDQLIRLWRASDGGWLGSWSGHVDAVLALAWSPDGNLAASGGEDRTLRIWNVATGQPVAVLPGHMQGVTAVAWGAGARTLVSASSDTTLRLWETERWTLLTTLRGHARAVNSVACSPNGATIASAGADGTIRLWQSADGLASGVLYGHTEAVFTLAWSPDGRLLASAGADKRIHIWRPADSTLLTNLEGHQRPITSLAWSPDGRLLASASADRQIRIWKVE